MIAIDTNVLVYGLDESDIVKHAKAEQPFYQFLHSRDIFECIPSKAGIH
jgi:predicted nucleic-acid-binding protein